MEKFLIKKISENVDGVPVQTYLRIVDGREHWISNPFHAVLYDAYPDAAEYIRGNKDGTSLYQIEKFFI